MKILWLAIRYQIDCRNITNQGFTMPKKVQMFIKTELELRRLYIAQQQCPNQVTITAMEELEQGKGVRFASIDELFKDLGISGDPADIL